DACDELVRVAGVEPARLAAQEPKSCASANSAIPAWLHPCIIPHGRRVCKREISKPALLAARRRDSRPPALARRREISYNELRVNTPSPLARGGRRRPPPCPRPASLLSTTSAALAAVP